MSGNWPDQSKGRRFSQERSPARVVLTAIGPGPPLPLLHRVVALQPYRRQLRPRLRRGPDSRNGRSCGAAALDGHLSAEGDNTPARIKLARHPLNLVQFDEKTGDVLVDRFNFRKLRKNA